MSGDIVYQLVLHCDGEASALSAGRLEHVTTLLARSGGSVGWLLSLGWHGLGICLSSEKQRLSLRTVFLGCASDPWGFLRAASLTQGL